ncbi:MAG TPA: helix-turn-helix domain-containing GNAT family N-acetyltransferase [Terriglobales bacterium]|nr:helix-turn-helix domain-containing GNAT family N-acetyltransferase [Terriglobales bacterium]
MEADAVQQVRSFNRIVAERIGALDDRFLQRDRPIGEARLLWEIGPRGAAVRELRSRLGIDSGYCSRVLRSLEKQRLVRTRVVPEDRRLRWIFLTRAGLAERAELEQRSDELATNILESLSDQQRRALTAAMRQVEQLLRASMVTFAIEPPTTPDARWCFDQYFAELNRRFDGGFDPGLSISADPQELTLPRGLLILGRLQGRPIACGALKFHKKEPAELKRMWVAESARGLGVGRRLLVELERHARKAGIKLLRLETNRALYQAIHLYKRSGYVEVEAFNAEPYAHHWFEKRLGAPA